MFRKIPEGLHKGPPRLFCSVCDFEIKDIPEHHGLPLRWTLVGSFRKVEKLACQVCDHMVEVPLHCGIPMTYSEVAYNDTASPTRREYEGILKGLREGE